MNFVLDNSVTMRWLFEDGSVTDIAYADRVLAALKDWTANVPVTWGLEVANVIARSEWRALVTAQRSNALVKMLRGLDIEVDAETFEHALSDTLELARRYKLSAYDASYLELALRLETPMATLDENLQKAGQKAGVRKFALQP